MNIPRPLLRFGGFAIQRVIRAWYGSLESQVLVRAPDSWPPNPEFQSPAIFLMWHEYVVTGVWIGRYWQAAVLLSQHRDAELLSIACELNGFQPIRGSSTRGGVRAIREIFRMDPGMSIGITPDGPTGPRRKLAPGCIYLASKLTMPLVLVGVGFDRPWRYRRAWDQSAIPRPFSRCRLIVSERIAIPERLTQIELEHYRVQVEHRLSQLSDEAETWAATHRYIEGAVSFQPAPQYFSRRRMRALQRKGDSTSKLKLGLADTSPLQRVG